MIPGSGSVVVEDGTLVQVMRGQAAIVTIGTTGLVAAQVGLRIRVLSVFMICDGNVQLKFMSGQQDITPVFPIPADIPVTMSHNPNGWFQTDQFQPLNINVNSVFGLGTRLIFNWIATE